MTRKVQLTIFRNRSIQVEVSVQLSWFEDTLMMAVAETTGVAGTTKYDLTHEEQTRAAEIALKGEES